MNEVLANLAGERLGREIRPNDEPNASQSSNDVFPSAIHVAACRGIVSGAHPRPRAPVRGPARAQSPVRARREVGPDPPDGRHPGDPGPGVRRVCRRGRERRRSGSATACRGSASCRSGEPRSAPGLNAPEGFAPAVIDELADDAAASADRGSGPLRGPGHPRRTGGGVRGAAHGGGVALQDLQRPAVDGERPSGRAGRDPTARPAAGILDHAREGQPGRARSGLPGRRPGDRQRRRGGLRRCSRQLRAQRHAARDRPQPARVHPPARPSASRALADKCVPGIEADEERCRTYALSSPAIATALNPYIGYEQAARVVKQAIARARTCAPWCSSWACSARTRSTRPSTSRP